MEKSPLQPTPVGAFRFNTDSSKLEYYDGNQWVNVTSTSPEAQTGGTRGFIIGGYTNAPVSAYGDISYINIDTTGASIDFGDTIATGNRSSASSSRTRAVTFWANSPAKDTIEYFTMSSLGDAIDFGNLNSSDDSVGSCSDSIRSVIGGGYPNPGSGPYQRTNAMQYITIASTGNGVDFGDLPTQIADLDACSSPTRGLFMGGNIGPSGPHRVNNIQYITIATTGNGGDFGDLTVARSHSDAGSNAVRGICSGGINVHPVTASGIENVMDYVTIASLGNAVDFGDCTNALYGRAVSTSSTRLVNACGSTGSADKNVMDYVQIMTTGNAVDFGDAIPNAGLEGPVGTSNAHGGLG